MGKGIFEETEQELIHSVFDFADTTVKEVMVPKHKFSAIDIDTHHDKVLDFLIETGFSRYPVYRETPDQIVGILYNKDVFPDNNASERAIRNVKVKQKISGQFKTGEQIFCILRSLIDTCKKRNVDVMFAMNSVAQL